jgi:hypothetical protein
MNASEAQRLADEFVAHSRVWVYKALGVKKAQGQPNQWVALYDVSTNAGEKFDGPVVVLIDEHDGVVRFLER